MKVPARTINLVGGPFLESRKGVISFISGLMEGTFEHHPFTAPNSQKADSSRKANDCG